MIEAHQSLSIIYFLTISFSAPGYPNYYNKRNLILYTYRILHTISLSHGPYAGGYKALYSTFPLGMVLHYFAVAHFFPHENGIPGAYKLLQGLLV